MIKALDPRGRNGRGSSQGSGLAAHEGPAAESRAHSSWDEPPEQALSLSEGTAHSVVLSSLCSELPGNSISTQKLFISC